MLGIAILRYPVFSLQSGSSLVLCETLVVLGCYGAAIVFLEKINIESLGVITQSAGYVGLVCASLEFLNIGLENGMPIRIEIPGQSILFMLTLFGLWGIAGFRITRAVHAVKAGILGAMVAAGICMLWATLFGFAIQFFIAPPDPASIATWAEFKRSGWADPRAFGIANTLEAGATHLVIAPIIAIVVGGLGAFAARRNLAKAGAWS